MGQHGFPMLQGDATAALAAIASRNRNHLPDAPLADGYAAAAARRGLADILANGRLRRRMALLLLAWLCLSLVWRARYQFVALPRVTYLCCDRAHMVSMHAEVYMNA